MQDEITKNKAGEVTMIRADLDTGLETSKKGKGKKTKKAKAKTQKKQDVESDDFIEKEAPQKRAKSKR
jgi:hypothetical protein